MNYNFLILQDSVRLSAIEAFISVSSLFPREYFNDFVMPTIHSCISENFWKIRYVAADQITEVHIYFIMYN